jgi:hypothetical protein
MNTKLENPGKTLGADLSANSVTVLWYIHVGDG